MKESFVPEASRENLRAIGSSFEGCESRFHVFERDGFQLRIHADDFLMPFLHLVRVRLPSLEDASWYGDALVFAHIEPDIPGLAGYERQGPDEDAVGSAGIPAEGFDNLRLHGIVRDLDFSGSFRDGERRAALVLAVDVA